VQTLTPEKRREYAQMAKRELMRRSFLRFVQGGYHAIDGTQLELVPHIEALCLHLQAVFFGWYIVNRKDAPKWMREEIAAHWARHDLTQQDGELLVQNLLINIAPGTLKSRIVMVLFPSWVWLWAPNFTWSCTSSNDENVKRDSQLHREFVTTAGAAEDDPTGTGWYVRTFGITWKIKDGSRDKRTKKRGVKSDSIGRWETTAGGRRLSRTLLSGFVGVHSDGTLVDDPDDPHRVYNDAERERTHSKWTKAIENRVVHEMRSIRIIIQQRVHVDDLSGYVLSQSRWAPDNRAGWAWLVIPMEYGKGPREAPDVSPFGWRDWRCEDGQVLQDDRFPRRVLDDKKRKLGTFSYEGQYNQNPEALDGGMMRRHWWSWFRPHDLTVSPAWHRPHGTKDATEHPAVMLGAHKSRIGEYDLDWMTITVDSTFGSTSDTASAVGILVVGGRKLLKYVFDDVTDVRTFLQTVDAIKKLIRRYPARRVLVELKANGTSVIEQLKKEMAEGDVIGPNGKPIIVAVEGMEPGKDCVEHGSTRSLLSCACSRVRSVMTASMLCHSWCATTRQTRMRRIGRR
jgi:hypothetical protein